MKVGSSDSTDDVSDVGRMTCWVRWVSEAGEACIYWRHVWWVCGWPVDWLLGGLVAYGAPFDEVVETSVSPEERGDADWLYCKSVYCGLHSLWARALLLIAWWASYVVDSCPCVSLWLGWLKKWFPFERV